MEHGGHLVAFFLGVINGLYRMGIHYIFGVCAAVFSVSALAADPPAPRGNVSVTVNPTTGYYSSTNSTVRLPNGVSASPTAGGLPVVSKYSGGLQQSIPTGITIDAIKKSAPLPAVVRATTQSVKNAATGCLTSAKCNVALILAGAGLQALFDKLDWVMDEGGQVQKSGGLSDVYDGIPSGYGYKIGARYEWTSCRSARAGEACVWTSPTNGSYFCKTSSSGGLPLTGAAWQSTLDCYYGGTGGYNNGPALTPVSSNDISSGVNSNYKPEPTDWPALTPELELNSVEITSAPTLQGEPKTTTVYDADGVPHEITETNIWYDFDIRDNGSTSPALDMKTRSETKTYKNGALTGTTTTESTATGGSGGVGAGPQIDIPTDCDFMPTVCAFLDWVKNDDTPEDPDLSALIDNRDFTETYSITGGSKQCPADYEFTVDFIGRTYGLSFEPACDFASKMYYFVMAAAYIFAAYITIGASRNG